ncbi:DUF6735 family protein [Haloplanus natans]|uniref:DUF6735 family protein n=1 Tax=Haloplanus natans TaxID=376171 RepID=UPI0006775CE4|nr:DUF6735 family protein [Haloplanus natans]
MGHRAFLVKQESENQFKYTYSHWGANKFKKLSDEAFYSEKDIEDEDLHNRFSKLWESAKNHGEEIETASSLDEVIDIERTTIEAYIIEDRGGELHAVFPTITEDVNVAVARKLNGVRELHRLKGVHRKLSNYITVAETQGLEEETIRRGVRTAITDRVAGNDVTLIQEDDNPHVKIFNKVSRVIP